MKILILGARGLLGSNLALMYSKDHQVLAAGKNKPTFSFSKNYKIDVTNDEHLEMIIRESPDLVINCVAITDVNFCEENVELTRKVNSLAAGKIAKFCKAAGAYFVQISTDAVFDGKIGNYKEEDEVNPISVYGETKLEAEKLIEKVGGNYSIIRTNIYGWNHLDKFSLAEWMLEKMQNREKLTAFHDVYSSPINVNNLGRAILELFVKKYQGIIHISGSEDSSKLNFARAIAEVFKIDSPDIFPISIDSLNFKAKRGKKLGLNVNLAKNMLKTKLLGIEEGLKEFKEKGEDEFLNKLKNKQFNNCKPYIKEMEIKIAKNIIGGAQKTYFIADIAANHDGNLERAKKLILLAKEAGADAAKFQHHNVKHYVSKKGFENLGGKFSHQSKWKKSVFDVYKEAEVPTDWTSELKNYCDKIEIDFFSTPYDLNMVDHLDPYVATFKIGSGDINFPQILEKVSKKGKPVMMSSGASTLEEVHAAIDLIKKYNQEIVLFQCNTNYTGSKDNFNFIHLNVLKKYKKEFPEVVLGLSDHTPGDVTVLGAVTLGAKVIEKHFTDDTTRPGPDHPFSMDPKAWRTMVERVRELEKAMGSEKKHVEENEKATIILQRRCIRANKNLKKGEILTESDLEYQRPAPENSFSPGKAKEMIGKKVLKDIQKEEVINGGNLDI